MKKTGIIIGGVILAAIAYFFLFNESEQEELDPIKATVQSGEFIVSVVTTGELEAKNSVDIYAPASLRKMGVNQIKVSTMVDEGTILKEGDFVATLDPSEIGTEIRKLYSELSQKESDLKAAKLDTSLTMRSERETLLNLKVELEQNQLELEQSKFEPPATQRKIEIQLEKTARNYKQAKSNIVLKEQQAVAKVFKVQSDVMLIQDKISRMQEVMDGLTIKAPQNGMLVYYENWNGKVKAGTTINTWNPVVASIPDLSEMISKTYVNEIDISKVSKNQKVKINIDAFPDLPLEGEVIQVANIGQQEKDGDAKVFEVKVRLTKMDSVLKPAMTTTNEIMIEKFEDVLSIPIEGVYATDSLLYVYKAINGKVEKQEIRTGVSNSTSIIIENGVEAGDEIYLIPPKDAENTSITRLTK
ncbi:MAG: HlyD family efflux transporter periplasmic adaptor subunit [Flavobacteriales bacterium]|jgi:multidrug efflux pump subunit AcrA (membrane-fusion protein)|nr:HlyD family efflux transporter periplasmic adaptor subunit [Flavobacteriales bacterium]